MRLNVLYQFNEKYAPYAGASMTSLCENNRQAEEIRIYVLGEGLSRKSVQRFKKIAQIYGRSVIFKPTETVIERMKRLGVPPYRGAYSANLRLFLPLVLDDDEKDMRILYLDADTIVMRPLDELFGMDMRGRALAMVLDSLGGRHKVSIGLRAEEPYYNSGVILFDMAEWTGARCTERIIRHIEEGNARYSAPDQDLLNIVCKDEIACLPPEYNLQPVHLAFMAQDYYRCYGDAAYYTKSQLAAALESAAILHCFRFLGEFSWHRGNLHPMGGAFDRYLAMSPWSGYAKEKSGAGWMMRVEKVLFRLLPRGMFLRVFVLAHGIYVDANRETSIK